VRGIAGRLALPASHAVNVVIPISLNEFPVDFDEKTFVLGIGAQKCGTTWLHDYLTSRGDVYMPHKEMHYFDAKYRPDICGRTLRRKVKKGIVDQKSHSIRNPDSLRDGNVYKDFFRTRVPEPVNFFGEITPAYALIGEPGYREIRELFPNIRIIFIMRDPVERFYSQMRMERNRRMAKAKPLRDIESLIEKTKYTERSSYETTVRALEKVFVAGEIIYLFYETLFRPESISMLCQALGLPYMAANFDHVANSGGAADPVPASAHAGVMVKFAPTYLFCRDRFGMELPSEWHHDIRER